MRLPWPFRREPPGIAPAAAPDAGPTPARAVGHHGAWKDLPVLSRTVADPQLVAGGEPFRADLAGAHTPEPILAPLGHDRTFDGPAGLVHGMATPVVARVAASAPAVVSQRSAAMGLTHRLRRPPIQRSAAIEPGPLAAVETTAGSLPEAERRILPALEPARTDRVERSLVHVASESVGVSIQREGLELARAAASDRPLDEGEAAPSAAPPVPILSGMEAVASSMPSSTWATLPAAAPAPPDRAGHTLQRTPGSRRVRLGPPIQRLHDGLTGHPAGATSSSPPPAGAAGTPAGTAPILPARPASSVTIQRARTPPIVAAPSSLPALPLARAAVARPSRLLPPDDGAPTPLQRLPSDPPPGGAGDTVPSVVGGIPTDAGHDPRSTLLGRSLPTVQPSLARPGPSSASTIPSASIVGRRPLAPAPAPSLGAPADAPLQRSAGPEAVPSPGSVIARQTAVPASDAPIKLHRGSAVQERAQALRARAFTSGGEIFLPDRAGPIDIGEGRALIAHELTHVRQQRALGDALPHPGSVAGRQLETEATETGAWTRSSELALAQRVPSRGAGHPAGPSGSARAVGMSVARMTSSAASEGSASAHTRGASPVVVQAAAADDAPTATPPAAPAADAGSTGAPAGGSPIAAMGERDLEELLRKLYPKLRHHFARELLVARERAGSLADAR